ncbi:SAM-dependent DNA methyltransferase [Avibacterium endocarditidis]|uniref:SAM-dependent DNA methyltransferase n=1 Tax=Avibacterium endocarditidis TaxID=380674 RepID=UPI0039FC5CA9
MEKLTKSKARVREFGEVFTSEKLVAKMLNLLQPGTFISSTKFLEPACGTGNFLYQVLERKLSEVLYSNKKPYYKVLNFYLSLASLYGVDIQLDNVLECQSRLKALFYERLAMLGIKPNEGLVDTILGNNIRRGNALEDTFMFLDLDVFFKGSRTDIDVPQDSFCLTFHKVNLQQNTQSIHSVKLLPIEEELRI